MDIFVSLLLFNGLTPVMILSDFHLWACSEARRLLLAEILFGYSWWEFCKPIFAGRTELLPCSFWQRWRLGCNGCPTPKSTSRPQ